MSAWAPGTGKGVYLARHGQTAYNLEGRFQGQLPVPLDELGREQAHALAERAAAHGFAVLWSSTLLRAQETAAIVAAKIGLEPQPDARLMETNAGDWTDRMFADVQAQTPELFAKFIAGDPSFAFPGGESFAQQEVRVCAALDEIEQGPLPALVVCHGMVIRAALSGRTGHWLPGGQRVPNGALVPLDPEELARTDLGGDGTTQAS
ncbi:MAG TPA: histidine phosphatase family protein [Solirubrobacteraceae bacterium]|jgi:broad specificity phosphatase PhoE